MAEYRNAMSANIRGRPSVKAYVDLSQSAQSCVVERLDQARRYHDLDRG